MKLHSDTDRSGGDRRTGTYPRHDGAVLASEGAPPRPAPVSGAAPGAGDAVLAALVRYQGDQRRQHVSVGVGSADRRRVEHAMADAARAFARLVVEHVEDEAARAAWRFALGGRGAPPVRREDVAGRLVYRGTTDAGVVLEIRERADGEHDVLLAGKPTERILDRLRLPEDAGTPLELAGVHAHERFGCPEDAIDALVGWGREGGAPPWRHASVLLEDGLVDEHFAVTVRGRRAIRAISARA